MFGKMKTPDLSGSKARALSRRLQYFGCSVNIEPSKQNCLKYFQVVGFYMKYEIDVFH
jgi:hypothetical protein